MQNTRSRGTFRASALAQLGRRLPPGWSVREPSTRSGSVTIAGPGREQAAFALVVRKGVTPREARLVAAAAKEPTLVVAPFVSARAQEVLAEAGVGYLDATGNVRVVAAKPAIFLLAAGADRDPEPRARPLHSLRGPGAARVVRALCELALPLGVRALAEASTSPVSTVSRVVGFLEAEALLERDDGKRVVRVETAALLARWARDYGVSTTNVMHAYLEPRGLAALWPKLASLPRYAVTGSPAGVGVAPTRLAMVYVDDAIAAAQRLELAETDAGTGANVWLLEPHDDVVFARARRKTITLGERATEVQVVAEAQAVVDLMTSPGRGPREAEALLEHLNRPREARR